MPSLISAVIPVYNGENFVAEAIESVLAQTYSPFELIVVDDGSTDNTAVICQRYVSLIRYHYQANQGLAGARNQGVELARGEFLGFLDADDVWEADKLALQMSAFEADPKLEAVFGHIRQFYDGEENDAVKQTYRYSSEVMPGYHTNTMLIHREAFERVGPFADQWKVAVFIEWYARARELNLQTVMLADILARRRIHKNNMGIYDQSRARFEYVRALKASLDRRREQS
jgi:glycosyltransferase involved in cell wall biosynthesis